MVLNQVDSWKFSSPRSPDRRTLTNRKLDRLYPNDPTQTPRP